MRQMKEFEISTACSISEVEQLREVWQGMVTDPNADIDFYLAIVQSRSEVLRPHVIVVKQAGAIRSILVGRLEKKKIEVKIGYKTIVLSTVNCLTLVHGGLLGDQSESCITAMIDAARECLNGGDADVVWFYGIDEQSEFYRQASRAGNSLTRDYFPGRIQRWKLQLPGTYDELHRKLSSNTKHNLKRYSKRLREAFGDQLVIKSFSDISDLDWVLTDSEVVAGKSYHRGLGVGFIDNEETRRTLTLAAKGGWLRAYVLYGGGKPCAFWNGFLYGRTFFTVTTAYDPDIRDYRPGTFLLQRMLQDLCVEKSADEVDFGFGDAQYKRDWCEREEVQASFFLFAPTLKAVFLNCIRTPIMGMTATVRQLLSKTGILQTLKRAWRDHLSKGKNQAAATVQDGLRTVAQSASSPHM